MFYQARQLQSRQAISRESKTAVPLKGMTAKVTTEPNQWPGQIKLVPVNAEYRSKGQNQFIKTAVK